MGGVTRGFLVWVSLCPKLEVIMAALRALRPEAMITLALGIAVTGDGDFDLSGGWDRARRPSSPIDCQALMH
jgi:hypothetical protein